MGLCGSKLIKINSKQKAPCASQASSGCPCFSTSGLCLWLDSPATFLTHFVFCLWMGRSYGFLVLPGALCYPLLDHIALQNFCFGRVSLCSSFCCGNGADSNNFVSALLRISYITLSSTVQTPGIESGGERTITLTVWNRDCSIVATALRLPLLSHISYGWSSWIKSVYFQSVNATSQRQKKEADIQTALLNKAELRPVWEDFPQLWFCILFRGQDW